MGEISSSRSVGIGGFGRASMKLRISCRLGDSRVYSSKSCGSRSNENISR